MPKINKSELDGLVPAENSVSNWQGREAGLKQILEKLRSQEPVITEIECLDGSDLPSKKWTP